MTSSGSWHIVFQRLEMFCGCGVGWQNGTHNIFSCTSSSKLYHTKHALFLCCFIVNISILNLNCISEWFIIGFYRCPSLPSVISSIHLVMMLSKKRTHAIFRTVSPKRPWQMSSAGGRINSSSRVKGFLTLAIWLATSNDCHRTDTVRKWWVQ